MNAQIRRLMVVVLAMFTVLMLAATYIQFFRQPALVADGRNARTIYNTYGRDRGPIIAAGDPVATSRPVDDNYKYLREYTQGPTYAFLTGYYSVTANSATGLERAADDVLSGTAPSLLAQRIQNLFTGKQPQGGAVEMTVDPQLQTTAYEALAGRRGAVVVLDAKTGAILAAVSSPSFDPNALADHSHEKADAAYKELLADPAKPLDNRAFGAHYYAPGSTFKIITAAAMLESGQFQADTTIEAPPTYQLPNTATTISNDGGEPCGSGTVTLTEAFALSCNTVFARAGAQIGLEKMTDMAQDFGFNKPLAIPLPVQESVWPRTMDPAQLAISSIGQYEVRATPLLMASVAQTVANGGKQMQPYLIKRELDSDLDVSKTTVPTVLGTPISAQTAAQLRAMMAAAVTDGTGGRAAVSGIEVAGKTGTAQVKDHADGWFVGFAPVADPQIAFAIVVEGDQDGITYAYGGQQAAPIAAQLVAQAVK